MFLVFTLSFCSIFIILKVVLIFSSNSSKLAYFPKCIPIFSTYQPQFLCNKEIHLEVFVHTECIPKAIKKKKSAQEKFHNFSKQKQDDQKICQEELKLRGFKLFYSYICRVCASMHLQRDN